LMKGILNKMVITMLTCLGCGVPVFVG